MYSSLSPNGSMKLSDFIAIITAVMIVLSQMPSFHSLRYINLGSLVLCFAYTFFVVVACLYAGTMENAPPRDYSLQPLPLSRAWSAFTSISILAAMFGIGILPEIQEDLAPEPKRFIWALGMAQSRNINMQVRIGALVQDANMFVPYAVGY